jgi:hypothetical protein
MSPRALRRAAERHATKQAAKVSKAMSTSVGQTDATLSPVNETPVAGVVEIAAVSEAQLLANRLNALKSHGAKTQAGREASAMNALTHGLTSKRALLPGDCAEAYEQLVGSHYDRYSPATDEESELVQLIADNAWRILRASAREAALLEVGRIEHPDLFPDHKGDPIRHAALVEAKLCLIYENSLRNLHLQERRVRNQHKADITRLKELQTERLERPKHEAQQAAEANVAAIQRAQKIAEQCRLHNRLFDPSEFGLDFTHSEWTHFLNRHADHFLVSREYLNVNQVIADFRAAQEVAAAA